MANVPRTIAVPFDDVVVVVVECLRMASTIVASVDDAPTNRG